MIGMAVSAVVCAVFVLLFLVCYIKSKGQYDEYLEYVDKEEYGLKDFIPLGLFHCRPGAFWPGSRIRSIRRFWSFGGRRMRNFTIIFTGATGWRQLFWRLLGHRLWD